MRHAYVKTTALLIILLVSFNTFATPTNTKIRLATGEWPPYISEHLPHSGLAVHLMNEAFKVKGITTELGFFSWKRAYDQAKAGRWDGTFVWRKTEEREKHFYFSDVVIVTGAVFFHRTDYPFSWENITDLKGLSIGVTNTYNYRDDFTQASQQGLFDAQVAESDTINFRKLITGRINIFPMEMLVGISLLNKDFTPEQKRLITFHKTPLNTNQQRIMLSKKMPHALEMIKLFNEGLAQLKASGHYQRIMDDFNAGRYSSSP